LGNGWDYDRGSKTAGNCISFHEEVDKAQDKTLTFDSVVDQENLADVLDVSLTVRAKALVGESSAKLRFMREVSFTGNHQNIVVRAVVRSGATYTGSSAGSSPGGPRLDLLPDYARLAEKSPWLFRKECGDFFVSAIHSGGELLAVYSFEQDIRKATETIDASLEGRGFGFEVDSSLAKKLTSNSDQQNLRIFYQQNGGAGNHLPTDLGTLLTQVQVLPEAVRDAPKPWRVTLQGYDTLPSWPQGSPSSAMTALDEAVRQYERLLSLYQQVGSIIDSPDGFVLGHGVDVASLKALQDQIRVDLSTLTNIAESALGGSAFTPANTFAIAAHSAAIPADYPYRIQLPPPTYLIEKAVALANPALAQQISDTNAAIDKTQKDLDKILNPPPILVGVVIGPPPKTVAQLQADLQKLRQQLSALQAQLAVTIDLYRDAVLAFWIKKASDARCAANFLQLGCLRNSDISGIRGAIPYH
jgi:hypothetical protein